MILPNCLRHICLAASRETKNARLLILGNPIANRNQPVRVAEEMAMIEHNISERLSTGEWDVNNQSFILHASTYLNQARWEDEVIGTAKTKTNTNSIKQRSLMDKVTDRSWAE